MNLLILHLELRHVFYRSTTEQVMSTQKDKHAHLSKISLVTHQVMGELRPWLLGPLVYKAVRSHIQVWVVPGFSLRVEAEGGISSLRSMHNVVRLKTSFSGSCRVRCAGCG